MSNTSPQQHSKSGENIREAPSQRWPASPRAGPMVLTGLGWDTESPPNFPWQRSHVRGQTVLPGVQCRVEERQIQTLPEEQPLCCTAQTRVSGEVCGVTWGFSIGSAGICRYTAG